MRLERFNFALSHGDKVLCSQLDHVEQESRAEREREREGFERAPTFEGSLTWDRDVQTAICHIKVGGRWNTNSALCL